MENRRYCKLLMVSGDANSNKWYEMEYNGGSNFDVRFGRVEGGMQTASYPYSKWNTKYHEKLRKGYKDVTDLVTVADSPETKTKLVDIKDKRVNQFMILMKSYTDNLVSSTYSVKAEAVTQKQVDEAQKLIDELTTLGSKKRSQGNTQVLINQKLVELYTVIPRKMRDVKSNLLPSINLDKSLQQEQDNLDAMALQVSQIKPKKGDNKKVTNLLEQLGISMKECSVNSEIKYLIDQISGTRTKLETVFEVNKPTEDKTFNSWMTKQKNKTTKILIHGTRCSSVIPILETGLKIRPVGNFQFSGKVYGEGNYYSETVNKSLNYTGWQNDKILLVYEVHTGNPFIYDGWYRGNPFTLNYKNLQERGFDSTFVKAGNGLLNSEIIVYNEQQCRIKYIIWLK